ncbi:HNH endonuclease [Gordonia sputi]|uniref:HNH endonuclease n=1 Tax=Gordonia sputi TaxID=36823 RepID=UPI003558280D
MIRTSRSPVRHIIPRSKGGAPFDPANVRPAHLGCNSARKDRELGYCTQRHAW